MVPNGIIQPFVVKEREDRKDVMKSTHERSPVFWSGSCFEYT